MQQKIKVVALAVAGALALSACGNSGGSVGVEKSRSTESGEKAESSNSLSVSGGKSAKASTVLPGAQVVAASLRPVAALVGIDVDAYARDVKFHGASILPVDEFLAAQHGYGRGGATVQRFGAEDKLRFAAVPASDVTAHYAAQQLLVCAELAADAKPAAWACYREAYTRIFGGMAVLATSSPQLLPGPGLGEGEVVDGFDKTRKFPATPLNTWLAGSVALIDMSVELQPRWLKGIHGPVLRDENAAKLHVIREVFATPIADIQRLAKRPAGLSARVTPGEAASALKVTIPERNWMLAQDEKGLTLVQNGSIWHGDGMLTGGKMEIALENSAASNVEQKNTQSTDEGTRNTANAKVGVNIN